MVASASLLELDPGLGQLLSAERRAAAQRQLPVEVRWIPAGPWDVERMTDTNPQHVGLLLLEGVMAREVLVSDTVSTELLGPGDVVRPWALQEAPPLLQLMVRWQALTASRVALLDRRIGARLSQWPEIHSVLIDRLNERAQRLATTQAICQLNRVDRRLLSLFWHLAEEWGRVTGEGIVVPLTLSHRMLGQLIGARRPTVSVAIADLAKREEVVRRDDGTWLLKGEPVGLPTGEAQKIIPIRRRLLGNPSQAGPDLLRKEQDATPTGTREEHHVEPSPAQAAAMTSMSAELHAALANLRADSQGHIDELRRTSAETQRLYERMRVGRELRRAARDRRMAADEDEPELPEDAESPASRLGRTGGATRSRV